ncbi:MAG: sugar transferase [Prevotellaceae bacterium]|nr:sugar transferase [Candidatus Minthosoma caballi]
MNTKQNDQSIDRMNGAERAMKRACDFVGAFLLLLLLSPVFFIIYIIQKINNPGPAIYKQERIGKGGLVFNIYKFRTMVVDAEKDGVPQLEKTDDPRLTDFGKLLRKHHFDELPQLVNVLKGDMSFVGYRPERKFFIDKIMEYNQDYELLFCSKPGITSLATILNGYTDTMDKMLIRLQMDLDYLKKRSLWLDAKIIGKTVVSLIN